MQAMGRPIRSIGDRALILLLDKRHSDRVYSKCYPSELKMSTTSGPETTTSFAKRFFAKVHGHRKQRQQYGRVAGHGHLIE